MKSQFPPVRTAAPAADPVSLEEAKRHLGVDFPDDDALITAQIGAAVAHLDGWAGVLGRCMVSQEWRQDFACWPVDRILRLPFPDVTAVTVSYFDSSDVEQTVASSNYELLGDHLSGGVWLRDSFSMPSLYDDRRTPVRVAFTAGYGAVAAVPSALKAAILMHVGHLYENRESVVVGVSATEVPQSYEPLIAPYRRVGL